MDSIRIYHNPSCSKSRQTLQLLKDKGYDPKVIDYLKTPPDVEELKDILTMLGLSAIELIRNKDYRELSLSETDDEHELIARMVKYPQIMRRPIVVRGKRACLGRPPENVLGIL